MRNLLEGEPLPMEELRVDIVLMPLPQVDENDRPFTSQEVLHGLADLLEDISIAEVFRVTRLTVGGNNLLITLPGD